MDRETALQNYREAVSRKIAAFRSHMGDSVLEHAEDWESRWKNRERSMYVFCIFLC